MSRKNLGHLTTADYHRNFVDVRDWIRRGMVSQHTEETEVNYQRRDSKKIANESIRLTWTPCNFGGWRGWFICPKCERRVAVIFCAYDLGCRRCYDLTYSSQRKNFADRACQRVNKIRKRLQWPPGYIFGEFGKPKSMHWNTFRRLVQEYRLALSETIEYF
jgi:hypothetical protein